MPPAAAAPWLWTPAIGETRESFVPASALPAAPASAAITGTSAVPATRVAPAVALYSVPLPERQVVGVPSGPATGMTVPIVPVTVTAPVAFFAATGTMPSSAARRSTPSSSAEASNICRSIQPRKA